MNGFLRKLFSVMSVIVLLSSSVFAKKAKAAENVKPEIIASTSWTAAFADIAGADEVAAIAPANLRHPPEYEVTVSDIQKISECRVFIFAGFERMMKTLGNSIGNVEMVRIHCNNSLETVAAETMKIARILGTEKICEKRFSEYKAAVENGKKRVSEAGYNGAKVMCNVNQIYLAKDLGFEVAATFGPGPVTSEQIAAAKKENFTFIIDNVHNPVGSPLLEVSQSAKYIVWRNFPEKVEHNSLLKVAEENIKAVFENIEK